MEERLRAALAARAQEVTSADLRPLAVPAPARSHHAWFVPLAAAAAVAAIVGGSAVLDPGGDLAPPPPAVSPTPDAERPVEVQPTPAPSATGTPTPAPSATPSARPSSTVSGQVEGGGERQEDQEGADDGAPPVPALPGQRPGSSTSAPAGPGGAAVPGPAPGAGAPTAAPTSTATAPGRPAPSPSPSAAPAPEVTAEPAPSPEDGSDDLERTHEVGPLLLDLPRGWFLAEVSRGTSWFGPEDNPRGGVFVHVQGGGATGPGDQTEDCRRSGPEETGLGAFSASYSTYRCGPHRHVWELGGAGASVGAGSAQVSDLQRRVLASVRPR